MVWRFDDLDIIREQTKMLWLGWGSTGQYEEKVFNGRIANKMTLGEAVVRGVLRALTYEGA